MTIQESFNEFLNSPGPSNYRGRGRGRGRGGFGETPRGRGGGGRGRGRGGFPGQGQSLGGIPEQSRRVFKTDYSSVGFDYTKIEKQGYVNMAGYNVSPFNPKTSYSGQSTPRGRGTGRGGFTPRGGGGASQPKQTNGHSGSATPVTGLGYHGAQESKARTTLTAFDVLGISKGKQKAGYWGGGMAPLFIKAGELFKDGEVDILTLEDDKIEVEQISLSDPAAPQMTHLQDDEEVEIMDVDKNGGINRKPSPLPVFAETSIDISALETSTTEEIEVIHWDYSTPVSSIPPRVVLPPRSFAPPTQLSAVAKSFAPKPPATARSLAPKSVQEVSMRPPMPSPEPIPTVQAAPEPILKGPSPPPREITPPSADADLFFVDTEPDTSAQSNRPVYDAPTAPPVGAQAESDSEQEEILFAPRQFADPAPLAVPVAPPPEPEVDESLQIISRVYLNPHTKTRAEKKAAKREKRRNQRVKKQGKKHGKAVKREHEMSGSDIDWGSDVPAGEFIVPDQSSDEDEREEKDVEMLRDYLAGTLLNAKSEQEDREAEAAEAASKLKGKQVDRQPTELNDQDEAEEDEEVGGEGDEGDWISESGSEASGSESEGDSSELGDLKEMLEFDSDEEEAFFTGKQSWGGGEDEWFVKSMDAALNGGAMDALNRKERNKIFKSIEEGDFEEDFPMAPVKKGRKNKMKDVPPALQNQWEKDRQKKALRKEQRHLQRMFEELNPQLGSGKKSRKKGKGNNKIRDVSLAHLLPGSANEVADMFDVSSSEDDGGPGGKMSKMRNLLLPPTMADLEVQIRDFLDDEGRTTFSLPPMDKEGRMKVHMLADCFSLKSKSKGSGNGRFTILVKTKHSGQNINERKVSRIVEASNFPGGGFYKNVFGKGKKGGGGKDGAKGLGDRGSSARAKEGDLVGEGADKIGEDNVGHKLLSKMGWAEGDKIGRTEGGLDAPIIAIVKYTKRGLGH